MATVEQLVPPCPRMRFSFWFLVSRDTESTPGRMPSTGGDTQAPSNRSRLSTSRVVFKQQRRRNDDHPTCPREPLRNTRRVQARAGAVFFC